MSTLEFELFIMNFATLQNILVILAPILNTLRATNLLRFSLVEVRLASFLAKNGLSASIY
jgi:hypothetical protein